MIYTTSQRFMNSKILKFFFSGFFDELKFEKKRIDLK